MIQNCMYYFIDFTVLSPFIFAFILYNVSGEKESSQELLWMDDTELYVSFTDFTVLRFLLLLLLKFSLMFPIRVLRPLLWMIQNCMHYFIDFTVLSPFIFAFISLLIFPARSKVLRGYYVWMIQNCMYYFMDFTVLSPFSFAFIPSNIS